MEKIVYRDGVPCKAVQVGWRVKRWVSEVSVPPEGAKAPYGRSGGSGQRETTISPRMIYVPLQDERIHGATCDAFGHDFDVDVDFDELERKAEAARKRSQRRAKQNCRHKVKHAGLDSLLTLTYRENMQDFDRMHRDCAAFVRIMKREIRGFRAVWAFERQDRGAWHAHLAIDRLSPHYKVRGMMVKSYELARRVWRRIVGEDGGNIDVDGHRGKGKRHRDARQRSLAKLAGYLSKYLTKDWGDTALYGRNMWGSTQNLQAPKPQVIELPDCSFLDAITLAFEVPDGHRVASHGLKLDRNVWWLFTEPDE